MVVSMVLKRPRVSERRPGSQRPKKEAVIVGVSVGGVGLRWGWSLGGGAEKGRCWNVLGRCVEELVDRTWNKVLTSIENGKDVEAEGISIRGLDLVTGIRRDISDRHEQSPLHKEDAR